MRVLVIGATGAIGTRLVPQLLRSEHEVVGTTRSRDKVVHIHAQGARPVVLDALDTREVGRAVTTIRPDAVIYEATALTGASDIRNLDRSLAATNRLRTDGLDNVLAAAHEAGVSRIVAQSFGTHRYARTGGPVKTEEDPLDPTPPHPESMAAMAHVDEAVTKAGGVALRYGTFYGEEGNGWVRAVRAGQVPIVGTGGGVWSFVHLEDAASATVLALGRKAPAIYNIVDDEPAPTGVWLTELATILGAPSPQHVSIEAARKLAGEAMVTFSTESRGASNARAKAELDWQLRYPTWRHGFREAYG